MGTNRRQKGKKVERGKLYHSGHISHCKRFCLREKKKRGKQSDHAAGELSQETAAYIKENKIMPPAVTWMDLETVILSEVS